MEEYMDNYDFVLKDANEEIPKKMTDTKPIRCNECNFSSSQAGNLRRHLKTHGGEKSNK